MIYKDKHGKVIKEGMTLKHDDGTLEKVYANLEGDDLGFNATNPKYQGNMPDQIYPLHQFNMKTFEIVE